jgi:hypothetical protein
MVDTGVIFAAGMIDAKNIAIINNYARCVPSFCRFFCRPSSMNELAFSQTQVNARAVQLLYARAVQSS